MADREAGRANNLEPPSTSARSTSFSRASPSGSSPRPAGSTSTPRWREPGRTIPSGRRAKSHNPPDPRASVRHSGQRLCGASREDTARCRDIADYFELFKNDPLQSSLVRQQYSNAGYIVLGLLIERLSGENYYEYVRRHIYEPAG